MPIRQFASKLVRAQFSARYKLGSSVSRLSAVTLILLLAVSSAYAAGPAPEVEERPLTVEEANAKLDEVFSGTYYAFKSASKPSPFTPFVRSPPEVILPDEVLEVTEPLEGLQLFEPAQLRLTAVLAKPAGEFTALITTPTGRGYTASVGTKVGQRGTVVEVSPTYLRIEEVYKMRSGKTRSRKLKMKLN